MAIKCKITTVQGLELDMAYINIQSPQIMKVKTEVITPATDTDRATTVSTNAYKLGCNACVYVNKDAYDAGKIPIEGFSVMVDQLDLNANVLTQAYDQLKLNERLTNIVEA